MIGWTLCSGIGAPEMAAPWLDWRFASEIEAFPRAVLQERFGYKLPADHNQGDPLLWGDMTEVTPELARRYGVPLPDLLVAGTPCQAFSIAGLRKGTSDARGNLTLKFVETCHAIVDARPDGKLAVLWENVPGVLSDKGNAFGCFLGGLVGADDALHTPDGGSWPSAGMVAGPRARAAWRVLDAQYFGVPQRRRRVFVVIDFGNCVDPAAVLFERQGGGGDFAPGRGARKDVAPTLAARTRGGGGLGSDFEIDGGLIPEIANPLTARMAKGINTTLDEGQTPIVETTGGAIAHTLTAGGHDASEDGTGRGTPVVAYALQERASAAPGSGPDGKGWRDDGKAYTLEARSSVQAVATGLTVRRLTPTECHRLQGFQPLKYRVRIETCRFTDLQKSLAVAGSQSLKSQMSAKNVGDQGFYPLAKTAARISITVHLDPERHAVVNVHMHFDQEQTVKSRAKRSQFSAPTAETKSRYRQYTLSEDIARQIVHMMREQERIARSQKQESDSTILGTGKEFVEWFGGGSGEFVSDAVIGINGHHQHSTFITSHLGQNTQVSVSTPKTWLSCVAAAILGCIPSEIPSGCSCEITFEREEQHCAIEYRGKPATDSPQYKALGNSMAVPVMRWILERVCNG